MLDEQEVFFPESFSSPSVLPRVLMFPAAAAECLAVCGFDSPEVLQGVGATGRTRRRLVSVVVSRRLPTKITGCPLSRSKRKDGGAFGCRGSARGSLLDRLTSSRGRTLWAKSLCPRKRDHCCPPSKRNQAWLTSVALASTEASLSRPLDGGTSPPARE